MSNTQGWGLTGRLVAKHFGGLGDKLAEIIANFDPETATEADRDRLAAGLLEAAKKLASARAAFNKEQTDVDNLSALISKDEQVAEKLAGKLADGSIDEATVNMFCDELEANKAKLPQEEQEASDAKAFLDEIQNIVNMLSKQLAEFDATAKRIKLELARADAQKDLQAMRASQQEQLSGLKAGMGSASTALGALAKRADKVKAEAEGMKIVADINQAPLDRAKALDNLRNSVTAAPAESAADRLKRITGKA